MTVLYLKIYILFSLFYLVARCWFGVLLLVNSVLLLNVLYPDIVYCYVTLIVRIASIEKQKQSCKIKTSIPMAIFRV